MSTTELKNFNVGRKQRSESERRFLLGQYTFKRRPSIPLHVITGFADMQGIDPTAPDTPRMVSQFEQTFATLVEPRCWLTATGMELDTEEAWQTLTRSGDEFGVIGAEDLADIVQWLVSGVAERPTGAPSDSPGGSETPNGGTPSMGVSPSGALTSTALTPEGASTPPTPLS